MLVNELQICIFVFTLDDILLGKVTISASLTFFLKDFEPGTFNRFRGDKHIIGSDPDFKGGKRGLKAYFKSSFSDSNILGLSIFL